MAITFARLVLVSALALVLGFFMHASFVNADAPAAEQTVMGPGLYMYQTRIDAASCGDADRTGYVDSFVAMVNGVPGSRTMDMHLAGSAFWPNWTLAVAPTGDVFGDADSGKGGDRTSHFEVKKDGKRFKGRGTRTYNTTLQGKVQRCSISYDALLVRIDS